MTDGELDADSDVQAVRFSISPNFEKNYDRWVIEGRPDRKSITVGRTSEALKSIGVKEQRITWDTTKINKALKKHSYLNDGILKQIPQLIDEPVIVMQSKSIDSRITMLGEVYDGDGLPVMAVLELQPTNYQNNLILDEIKIVSTHSRKSNQPDSISQTQNIINSSKILYVEPDKNRTNSWLALNRLQLPLSVSNYGSINNISYPDENVNDEIEKDMRNSRETTPEREAQYRDIPLSKKDARYKADTRMVRADYQLVERVFKDGRRVVIHDFHRHTGDDVNAAPGYNDLIIKTTGGEYNAKRMPVSYKMKNLRRTMREFFGDEGYEVVKEALIYPMEDSKLTWQALLEDYTDVMKDVTDRLGIKKGSKLSAALMYYGEWVRPGNLGDMPVDDPEFNRAKKSI